MRCLFLLFLIAAVVVGVLAYGGLYDVSASRAHAPVESWLLENTLRSSVRRAAADVSVPENLAVTVEGVREYHAMCVACHGAPGVKAGAVAEGMQPKPPHLADEALEWNDAELFQITKHGIRFTGMPAWGANHDDDALWQIVGVVRQLPRLSADEYRAWTERAGAGEHAH